MWGWVHWKTQKSYSEIREEFFIYGGKNEIKMPLPQFEYQPLTTFPASCIPVWYTETLIEHYKNHSRNKLREGLTKVARPSSQETCLLKDQGGTHYEMVRLLESPMSLALRGARSPAGLISGGNEAAGGSSNSVVQPLHVGYRCSITDEY